MKSGRTTAPIHNHRDVFHKGYKNHCVCMCTFNIEHDAISYITAVCEATLVPNRKNLQQFLLDLCQQHLLSYLVWLIKICTIKHSARVECRLLVAVFVKFIP